MSIFLGGLVIKGIAFEIHGERYMYPELDETGKRINLGFDYYDIYTMGHSLGCLDCVNTNHPFYSVPTKKELGDYLVSIDFFSTLANKSKSL